MPFNIQGPELIILLVIALLVLGPGKLPEVGSALGKSIREFRKAATDVKESVNIEPAKTVAAAPVEAPRVTAPPAPPAPSATMPSSAPAEPVTAAPAAPGTDTPAS
jgi:TatA/E family protein of Tat protein translocase